MHEWCDRNRTECDALVPTSEVGTLTNCRKPTTWLAPLRSLSFPLAFCDGHRPSVEPRIYPEAVITLGGLKLSEDDMSEYEEQPYFTGNCTCAHEPDDHEWGSGCKTDGCPCQAGWEE